MEEITEQYEASERDAERLSGEKKEKLEKETKQAQEVRKQALERIGETKKRKVEEGKKESKVRRPKRQGTDTIEYLKEKATQDMKLRQEEQQLKKETQCALENQHSDMMSMFKTFQEQQQQQHQQMYQVQMGQQQQSQVLLTLLKQLADK